LQNIKVFATLEIARLQKITTLAYSLIEINKNSQKKLTSIKTEREEEETHSALGSVGDSIELVGIVLGN
jgi:hypothetical protein